MFKNKKLALAIALGLIASPAAAADFDIIRANGLNPLAPPETAQWGQLVGSWEMSYEIPTGDGTSVPGSAEWHFFYILDGFAIGDIWIAPPPGAEIPPGRTHNQHGINIRSYNSALGHWEMAWIENQNGALSTFTGWAEDRDLYMTQRGVDDIIRIKFYNISETHFDWIRDRSTDGGESWSVEFEIHGDKLE